MSIKPLRIERGEMKKLIEQCLEQGMTTPQIADYANEHFKLPAGRELTKTHITRLKANLGLKGKKPRASMPVVLVDDEVKSEKEEGVKEDIPPFDEEEEPVDTSGDIQIEESIVSTDVVMPQPEVETEDPASF